MTRRDFAIFGASMSAAVAVALVAPRAHALDATLRPDAAGWIRTGQGVRTVTFLKVRVCTVSHDMKSTPPQALDRSSASVWALKDAVVDRDVDKKVRLVMMRDVDPSRIRNSFSEAYDNNGYKGAPDKMANRAVFLSALASDLKENDALVVSYDAAAKTTTLTAPDGRKASVNGVAFMKATWRIWFGRGAEQIDLGDQMVSRLVPP